MKRRLLDGQAVGVVADRVVGSGGADMGARGINRLVALIDGEAVPQMELRQPGLIIRTSSQLSALSSSEADG